MTDTTAGEGVTCTKCGAVSGDDWKQCGGSCPMQGSPHYSTVNALHEDPHEMFEHFISEAISNSPQPLQHLGDFLTEVLDEHHWKTAERYLLALAAQPSAGAQGEAVGVAGVMPGTDGFTMAAFKASDVPVGNALYATPAQPDIGDVAALREACVDVVSHASDWRTALTAMLEKEVDDGPQTDEGGNVIEAAGLLYWQHQLNVLDRILAALSKPNAPGREG